MAPILIGLLLGAVLGGIIVGVTRLAGKSSRLETGRRLTWSAAMAGAVGVFCASVIALVIGVAASALTGIYVCLALLLVASILFGYAFAARP